MDGYRRARVGMALDLVITVLGSIVGLVALVATATSPAPFPWGFLLCIPVVIAENRFPMTLRSSAGSRTLQFSPGVLFFLFGMVDAWSALAIWGSPKSLKRWFRVFGCVRPLAVHVNVSAQQLRGPRLVDQVRRVQEQAGVVDLVLELTERDFVGDDTEAVDMMMMLAANGVRFAIDDFCVGFSSIGYYNGFRSPCSRSTAPSSTRSPTAQRRARSSA